jgi:hypothetical protein
MEGFSLNDLNEVEDKQKYHVKTSNKLAALQELNAEGEINSHLKRLE